MTLICEADHLRDFDDRNLRVLEQALGAKQSAKQEITVRRFSRGFAERSREVIDAEPGNIHHPFQWQIPL
jgi:hypothetical protein